MSKNKIKSDSEIDSLVQLHELVKNSGKYNFESCRSAVNTKIDTNYMRNRLRDYSDKQVCDLLEFGFPIGFVGNENWMHAHKEL